MDLLLQLARVCTDEDRRVALENQRRWAASLEAQAAPPLDRRSGRSDGVTRVGFLSSDLRHHVVGFFAQPLFQFQPTGFEVYGYSGFPGPRDPAEEWFSRRSKAFRRLPSEDSEAAALVRGDDLDVLIEMGGPTGVSRVGVMAHRPARVQMSWLGFPQSLGLSAIDYMILDPHLLGGRRDLLVEQPLCLPSSWICMAPAAFPDGMPLQTSQPVSRNGFVRFGTANDPYKYNPRLLAVWARVVAAVPGSRFRFIRPEAGSTVFQANMCNIFAAEGVANDRLEFIPRRGAVQPLIAELDINLDTFPVTGGTSTCDALWQGVPTVTMAGQAVYERLGASILANAGLCDLVATDEEQFVALSVALAADVPRLEKLRSTLRQQIRQSSLGSPLRFAGEFYSLVAGAAAAALRRG